MRSRTVGFGHYYKHYRGAQPGEGLGRLEADAPIGAGDHHRLAHQGARLGQLRPWKAPSGDLAKEDGRRLGEDLQPEKGGEEVEVEGRHFNCGSKLTVV